MITRLRGVFLMGAAGVLALTAAACGDDDADSSSSAQQGDVDAIAARMQQNEVLFAIKAIGDLPLHDMDEAIQGGDVPDDALPNARDVIRYVGLTDWPADLEGGANDVQAAAIALVTALDDGDAEAAKQPATDLHEAWHAFEGVAWAEIGGDLPAEAGIRESHGGDASNTPAAGTTPAPDDDHGGDATAEAGDDHGGDATSEAEDDHSE